MDYMTKYYKNLCEQLQEKINLLEAGLKKAVKSGDPKLLAKEGIKAGERFNRLSQKTGEKEHTEESEESEKKLYGAKGLMQNLLDIDQQLDSEAREIRKISTKKYVTQSNIEKSGLRDPFNTNMMHVTPSQY